jgi:hypothetical protein
MEASQERGIRSIAAVRMSPGAVKSGQKGASEALSNR